MRYIIGLDVGIGTVGWSAVQYDEPRHILDFGIRAFESGENARKKKSNSQMRRGYRSVRRLERRRSFRKSEVKRILCTAGIVTEQEIEEYYKSYDSNKPLELRVKGLDFKLKPAELAACLINICNRRGYRDFYELDETDLTDEEKKEYLTERAGAETVDNLMNGGNYRTVAEMILSTPEFDGPGNMRSYRNRQFKANMILINRKYMQNEVEMILRKQQEFYPAITDEVASELLTVIFRQRDFEDGPGDVNDPYRKYSGFLDTYGTCRFMPDKIRGCRMTVLADVYALVNELSQFKYYDSEDNEVLPPALAKEFIDFALCNGTIDVSNVKTIAKKHDITVLAKTDKKNNSLSKCLKYIKPMKEVFEACEMDWSAYISENYRDMSSFLNYIGTYLSQNITPARRIAALRHCFYKLDESFISKLSTKKFSGTTNVCVEYMISAIDAFLSGIRYGEFQAQFIKRTAASNTLGTKRYKKLPDFEKDKDSFEFYENKVVCRAINETRKVLNAIIERYGSPYAINLRVCSELGHSFDERDKYTITQRTNEKKRAEAKEAIAKILGIAESAVSEVQIERYRLGQQQGWICMYSGEEIDKAKALDFKRHEYDVDHIVPYSLILDNTLENKVLVSTDENWLKGQRTPLMYMGKEQAKAYKTRVQKLYKGKKDKKISDRKYAYLMQPDLNTERMDEWKSRNLNDTRYITSFLVRYLSENLEFDHSDDEGYRRKEVFAMNGYVVSRLRRLWLNEATWGRSKKSELRKITLLDHAVDAVVIACALPPYVEIATVQDKLRRIYKQAHNVETEEYEITKANCIDAMWRYHGIPEKVVSALLRRSDRTPCLIPNLREEVDARFIEPITFRFFGDDEQKAMSDDEIYQLHTAKCREMYPYDKEFADSIRPLIVSHKPRRKSTGNITKDNAIALKEIDGVLYQVVRTPILSLTKKQLPSLYTDDITLKAQLEELMEPMKDGDTVQAALKLADTEEFVDCNGRKVNCVTVLKTPKGKHYPKQVSDTNTTILDVTSYYCIELYRDKKGNLRVLGITFSDLKKKDGKLWLADHFKYPDDYAEHIMYLHKWDYIRIRDKNGALKFSGYYAAVCGINSGRIYYANDTTATISTGSIGFSKADTVTKHPVDILGKPNFSCSLSDTPLSHYRFRLR